MYFGDHNPPHFHVEYGGDKAVIGIGTLGVIEGRLPPRIRGMVVEWAAQHQEELLADWVPLRLQRLLQPVHARHRRDDAGGADGAARTGDGRRPDRRLGPDGRPGPDGIPLSRAPGRHQSLGERGPWAWFTGSSRYSRSSAHRRSTRWSSPSRSCSAGSSRGMPSGGPGA